MTTTLRPLATWGITTSFICLSFLTMATLGCKSSTDSTSDDAAKTGELSDADLDEAGKAIDEAVESATKAMEDPFAEAEEATETATDND